MPVNSRCRRSPRSLLAGGATTLRHDTIARTSTPNPPPSAPSNTHLEHRRVYGNMVTNCLCDGQLGQAALPKTRQQCKRNQCLSDVPDQAQSKQTRHDYEYAHTKQAACTIPSTKAACEHIPKPQGHPSDTNTEACRHAHAAMCRCEECWCGEQVPRPAMAVRVLARGESVSRGRSRAQSFVRQ